MRLEPKKVEKASSRSTRQRTLPGHEDTKRVFTRASSMGLDDDCSPGYPPDDLMIQGLGHTMQPASSLLKTIPLGGFWECLHFRNLPTHSSCSSMSFISTGTNDSLREHLLQRGRIPKTGTPHRRRFKRKGGSPSKNGNSNMVPIISSSMPKKTDIGKCSVMQSMQL